MEQVREFRLRDRKAAEAFNRSLPCRADVTDVEREGGSVVAAFRLRPGTGPSQSCGGDARVRFRFRDGKFSEWRQLAEPSEEEGDVDLVCWAQQHRQSSGGAVMAGLGGRMSTVIKAKISKLLDRAEDPGETLDYGYNKQLELLQNVKKGIADVVTSKKRLQMQSQKLEQQVVKLDTQARQALSQGREDLARAALERKTLAQTELQSLDAQIAELEQQQEQLTENERKLRQKIEAFRTKKEVIKAQYSAAEAQVKIGEAASGVGEEMADLGLGHAARRGQDRADARPGRCGRGAGGRGDLRRHHPARPAPGRHRPRAGAARRRRPGGRRAGQDEGRARAGEGQADKRALEEGGQ